MSKIDYFGGLYSGFVEKQQYKDEINYSFEKYFDAVGNLLKEVKYAEEDPGKAAATVKMETDYYYDSLYRLIKVKTPENKYIFYSYDGYGRQSQRITPDAGQTSYYYDKNNNLIFTQDANQASINSNLFTFRNYDGINRLTGTGEAIIQEDSPGDEGQYQPTTPTDYLTVNVYDTLSSSVVNGLFIPPSDYYSPTYNNFTKGNLVSTAYRTRKTDNWSFKYYRYDERGRVIRMWNTIDGLGYKDITYHQYNSQDQITQLNFGYETEHKRYSYYYDFAGRLGIVNYSNSIVPLDKSVSDINFTNYTYNPNSLIDFQFFNSYQLQNQYNYDSRNWIISMNSIEGLFGFTNTYFKNGNLQTQLLFGTYRDYMQNKYNLHYNFSYDNSNRLLNAINTNSGDLSYSVLNTYDKDGNITTLKRYGDNNTVVDDFQYQYFPNTNKLRSVSGSLDQFNSDLNGNTILDDLNGNYNIKYDHRNLITELYHNAVEGRAYVYATRYYYDESGNRVRKLVYLNSQTDPPPITDWNNPGNGWTLLNNEFYVKGADGKDLATYQGSALEEWFVWGNDLTGKIKGDKRYFYYKDHLGSIRAVADNTGNIVAGYDYDAWGYPLENRNYNGDSIKFKYTGKELDKESLYDYFGARYYDAKVGRWGTTDPLMNIEPSETPYHYVSNNPLSNIDPNGLNDFYYSEGKQIGFEERGWLHNFLFGDSYYVKSDQGDVEYNGANYFQALSEETVKATNWIYVDANWGNNDFYDRISDALSKYDASSMNPWTYAYTESHELHQMDQKHKLKPGGTEESQLYLYVFNNVAMNWDEAGNAVWGKAMRNLGFSYGEVYAGAQAYSLKQTLRFDQSNDVNAFTVGYFNASYVNGGLWSREWIK